MANNIRVCNRLVYEDEIYHHGILGQKWGRRRYQNDDGSLTAAGKKRYDADLANNPLTKEERRKGGRAVNANKWVTEDVNRHKKLVDSSNNAVNQLKTATNKKKEKPRMDLSGMSDQQLREAINRRQLENQYNNLFNAPETSKGRERVSRFLDGAGTALTLTGAGLGVALSVRELRNK